MFDKVAHYRAAWEGREGRPRPPPALRPAAVDAAGLPCQRCQAETPADELVLFVGAFWLCPSCVHLLRALARRGPVARSPHRPPLGKRQGKRSAE